VSDAPIVATLTKHAGRRDASGTRAPLGSALLLLLLLILILILILFRPSLVRYVSQIGRHSARSNGAHERLFFFTLRYSSQAA